MWKIAIIDDDRQVLKGMKQVIPWEELNAEWVGESLNGARGLELIRAKQPDIVITDIYMPIINGLKMIEILREEQYKGKFLIHSGYSDFEVARKALRLSVEDYLSKPVSRNTIRDALLRAIASIESEKNVILEQEKLRDQLMLYEPFVRKELLKTAVTGMMGETEKEAVQILGYGDSSHMVIGLEIMRTSRIAGVKASDRLLFRFAIQNIIQEILEEEHYVFDYVELHGYHAALILHFDKSSLYSDIIHQVKQSACKLIDCIHQYLQIDVRMGVGGLKQSWADISDSMEEAFQFLTQEAASVQASSLYEYTKLSPVPSAHAAVKLKTMKFYQELVEDIKQTQGKNAPKIIRHYISALKQSQHPQYGRLQLLGAQFWAILSYALNDEEISLEAVSMEPSIERELSQVHTVDQYESWLNGKIAQICLNQQWHDNFKHKIAIDFIKQYIYENYSKEITISDLAEKVFISKNYLSQIFKDATGETINNFIIRVKMEKAKGMLFERKYKIYEIAASVGYKNIPYFSTTFKKHFGVTPAELIQ
ncbi:response regulator transcription factor [Paenibacillus thalictri]|uniref:Response regulator n=1 Tax=Paenibacillus thalictri TaxID=2527873 RepID=A0A4Q9DI07_9BACL|nr:response regulator [Paenibacillus thalictri]TBL70088.1 response regulator [Paenibacillus thalictri]